MEEWGPHPPGLGGANSLARSSGLGGVGLAGAGVSGPKKGCLPPPHPASPEACKS